MKERRSRQYSRLALFSLLWLTATLGACDGVLEGGNKGTTGDASQPGDGDEGTGASPGETDINNGAWSDKPSIDPFRPLVRRLTHDELRYTIYDVLDVALSDEELAVVPTDRPLEGFVNVATSQTVLPEHVQGYADVSEVAAARFDWSNKLTTWGVCTDANPTCAESLVAELGKRLFRQPLSKLEARDFGSLATAVLEEEGADFLLAADAVMRAMLQSPQFIYRIEKETGESNDLSPGEAKTVGGFEMATRLSYMLWGSAPDDELYAAAESGDLDTNDGIAEQLARMLLTTDRARRVTDRYMKDWGRLEALPDDGGLKDDLVSSVVSTYSAMLWDSQLPLTDVFTASKIQLTPTLATNYGLTASGDGLQTYDINGADGRVGLLTHPGLIAGMTNADGGAIVARGLFLQTQLFCQETPSPPMGLQGEIDAFLAEMPEDASDRLIAETRLERRECGNCHEGFDPLAYGLERFDYQGRFRDTDEYGNPLTTDGWIPGRVRLDGGDVPYSTVEELSLILQNEPAVHECVTEQHLKYALGRTFAPELAPLVHAVFEDFSEQGGTYQAMLEAIARSDLFRKMKVE